MALDSDTQVTNRDPATVTVTIREDAPQTGGATLNVYIQVSAGDAIFRDSNPAPAPGGARMNPAKTMVVWNDQTVLGNGTPSSFVVQLDRGQGITGCIPVTCIIDGDYDGQPHLEMLEFQVCFP